MDRPARLLRARPTADNLAAVGRFEDGHETRILESSLDGAEVGLRVEVLSGPRKGELHDIPRDRPFIIGSSPEASLPLEDDTVSRFHLELVSGELSVRARDLGSTNGSFHQDARFRELELFPGAALRVGQTELRIRADAEQASLPPSEATAFGGMLGRSLEMRRVFALLERAAQTDATVLVTGETGTGKEVVAEVLHQASRRRDKPLVVVDCSAIPAPLVESELFGHVRGAYTHAVSDRLGAFREADGGTVFLDELGELPLELQPRLLRVLETQTVKPVGSNTYHPVDVRIVAATNRNLVEMVRQRRFRSDLYFRLAVIRVSLPPLRDRREDIPLLARHFARALSPSGRTLTIRPEAMAALISHDWPGNVRELRNVLQQAVSLSAESLSLALELSGGRAAGEPGAFGMLGFEPFFDLPFREARKEATAAFELAYVKHRIARADGNLSAAARDMGLHRNMVRRILNRERGEPDEVEDGF